MNIRIAALALALSSLPAQAVAIDIAAARGAIAEARQLCEADGRRLWNVSLCGPILLVDPATHDAVASAPGSGATLRADGDVFVGRLPDSVGIANTALDWDGTRWIALRWPLPDDAAARGRLLMHESWHRVQQVLGLPASSPSIAGLDSLDGRIRLRLEWRALAAALSTHEDAARRQAIADALAFRAWRRSLDSHEAADENALELNEGLAEYTGRMLSGERDPLPGIVADLRDAENASSFVRSFAYHSGPAYGVLLDRYDAGWRGRLSTTSDLGALLATAANVSASGDPTAAATRYDGRTVIDAERARDRAHRERLAAWRKQLVDGAVLVLPFADMHIQFDPNTLTALPPDGTVYPTLHISDRWGVLDVERGALIDEGWSAVRVAAPKRVAERHIAGDGWTLDLADGWSIVPATRKGDYTIAQDSAAAVR